MTRLALGAVAPLLAALFLFPAASVSARQAPAAEPLGPIAALLGKWTGTSEGQPGNGTVERVYERALGPRFIRVRNRSTYPPQEKNPKANSTRTKGSSASIAHASASCCASSSQCIPARSSSAGAEH